MAGIDQGHHVFQVSRDDPVGLAVHGEAVEQGRILFQIGQSRYFLSSIHRQRDSQLVVKKEQTLADDCCGQPGLGATLLVLAQPQVDNLDLPLPGKLDEDPPALQGIPAPMAEDVVGNAGITGALDPQAGGDRTFLDGVAAPGRGVGNERPQLEMADRPVKKSACC